MVLLAYGVSSGSQAALGVGAALGLVAAAAAGLALSVEPPGVAGLALYARHASALLAGLAEALDLAGVEAVAVREEGDSVLVYYSRAGRPPGEGLGVTPAPYVAVRVGAEDLGLEGEELEPADAVAVALVERLGLGRAAVSEARGRLVRVEVHGVSGELAELAGGPVNPFSLYALAAAAWAAGRARLARVERAGGRVVVEVVLG